MVDQVPNLERGEVSITLDGKTFVMRPTPDAVSKIEARNGRGLRATLLRFVRSDYTLDELTSIVFEGLKAAGEPAVYDKTRELIYKTGYDVVAVGVYQFIVNATTGGRQEGAESGEAKAAGTTTSTTAASAG